MQRILIMQMYIKEQQHICQGKNYVSINEYKLAIIKMQSVIFNRLHFC